MDVLQQRLHLVLLIMISTCEWNSWQRMLIADGTLNRGSAALPVELVVMRGGATE